MIVRVHKRGKEIIVAACDEELIDKTFKCGELRIHVSKHFYGDTECDEKELLVALRHCTTANLVGKRCVDVAIHAGFVKPEGIIQIGEIPHAQLFKMHG